MKATPVAAARTIERRDVSDPVPDLPEDFHPVLARIYAARRLESMAQLDHRLDRLPPPAALKGIDVASELLADAIRQRRRILFVGDFDADGATSCALGVRALNAMGAAWVEFLVPNRFEFGYGLTPEIVDKAAELHPDLIVTVDNGISSLEGVSLARQRGIDVLITDHHLPADRLPEANAIVNPNQPGDCFPSRNLAGVGVIFYVISALRAKLRDSGWFAQQGIAEPNLAAYLDLVALGTVADVVPLDHVNRILVAQGLARINGGQACAGIRAMLAVARKFPGNVAGSDLGFGVAPRLNAAGRLDDMSLGIRCLLTDDETEAQSIARQLDELNQARRDIEQDMRNQALDLLENLQLSERLPKGLCLFDENWHQGVIGILAARVREHTHRPVIALAPGNEEELKGSARSINGLHIRDVLDSVAARHPGLIEKFGGHAMAAGLTLRRDRLQQFRQAFEHEVEGMLDESDLTGRVLSDGELPEQDMNLDFAERLRAGGPWGQAFPEPTFDGEFEVVQQRIVGDHHLKMVLRPRGGGRVVDAIAFNITAAADSIRAVYRLDVNEFRGSRSAQFIIEHMEPC